MGVPFHCTEDYLEIHLPLKKHSKMKNKQTNKHPKNTKPPKKP